MRTVEIIIAAALLSACSTESYRGAYDLGRDRNEALQHSPLGQKPGDWPPFDQYERERRDGVKPAR